MIFSQDYFDTMQRHDKKIALVGFESNYYSTPFNCENICKTYSYLEDFFIKLQLDDVSYDDFGFLVFYDKVLKSDLMTDLYNLKVFNKSVGTKKWIFPNLFSECKPVIILVSSDSYNQDSFKARLAEMSYDNNLDSSIFSFEYITDTLSAYFTRLDYYKKSISNSKSKKVYAQSQGYSERAKGYEEDIISSRKDIRRLKRELKKEVQDVSDGQIFDDRLLKICNDHLSKGYDREQ